jgi:XTP/dITP diphosphohydrolase
VTKLLIATWDDRVFEEITTLVGGDGLEFVRPRDARVEIPEESGATFEQNAMEAADHAARASALVALAESSGIVVDALDGAPGVSSARYAGTNATDEANRSELLRHLQESPSHSRSARLMSVVGVAHPDGRLQTFESTLEGVVALEERGVGGSGYEPIFELDDGMTIAELLPDSRKQVHPRAVALAAARPFIDELLAGQGA